ncbi:MAG: aminodeoxychorismate synthase component I [Hyphomicrobiales bacterium]
MTPFVLLDDSTAASSGALLYTQPERIIEARSPGEAARAIEALAEARARGLHLAGFLSYELGYALEPKLSRLMPPDLAVPLLWFGVFGEPRRLSPQAVEEFLRAAPGQEYAIGDCTASMSREDYRTRFGRARSYIAAGDIYQLNLTFKAHFGFTGSPAALYSDLRKRQRVRHGAFISTGREHVLSSSPELFLDIRDGHALTRPMKGTARRGRTLGEDREIARWLAADEKSRAENLMITDLMRNDLGRVASIGSVRTPGLFDVETFATLHQMTSDVEADLRPGTGIGELLHALFPPGSVTGAPKLRAMEIIRELESSPRGVYTGAMGCFTPDGGASLNVAIRTLVIDAAGRGEIGIGSGVVSDSSADAEYDECLLKMRYFTEPVRDFQLIETLRQDPQGYYLLDRHMERLESSAQYFGWPCDAAAIRAALAGEAARHPAGHHRTRLLLFADGRFTVTSAPMAPPAAAGPMSYVFSDRRVNSAEPLVYHKTTLRELYDGEHARLSAATGADEVLFLNERGELAEGSRTSIFIRLGGRLLTPALWSGLLPGTFRAELLATGEAEEAVLWPRDLEIAETVYLGNSVRGLLPAHALGLPLEKASAR